MIEPETAQGAAQGAAQKAALEAAHGLACPNCGGVVPIPEGQVIVHCPYCDLRSLVRGERGLQRYQVPRRLDREKAGATLQQFLSSSRAIASGASRETQLVEIFTAYIPFWASWARVVGWVLGEKKVGSGDDARYEPREIKITEEMNWNGVACDVGEFGVEAVPLLDQTLDPFDADTLHATGLVFEPVGSLSDAKANAELEFKGHVQDKAKLDRISQVFTRFLRHRMGLVYYPLWVLRYLYRGRSFQVVVDGYSGKVLYGKAPGSTLYRAVVLVGGMALGAVLAVDGSALSFWIATQSDGDGAGAFFFGGLALLGLGFGLMLTAYRRFRYGEHYEFRQHRKRLRGADRQLGESLMQAWKAFR